MKKTYITPTLFVEKIRLSQFICVSGKLDSTQEITDVNNVGAKGGMFWSDDEPEVLE